MYRRRFPQQFFEQSVLTVARNLLGSLLETGTGTSKTSGIIVETEAYHERDPASHSHRGKTKRTEIMFREGGHCYVYFIYGMHYCVNVVAESEGVGAAVLIRAVEPLDGVPLMKKRRGVAGLGLTNGPAKLCEAFGIDQGVLGEHLSRSKEISVRPFRKVPDAQVEVSRRIGISKAKTLPWRFTVRGNPWVSRGQKFSK